FGNVAEEHYLGNELISALTDQAVNELWVDMEEWEGITAYAHYQAFHIDISRYYRLNVFNYEGTAGEYLIDTHDGQHFTTFDADHDSNDSGNCAEMRGGAWWYNACSTSDLNGPYGAGFYWGTYNLKKSKMMIRPYSLV
ncbi:unnamed protein product, partial [Meganyctiphanes norvegica]